MYTSDGPAAEPMAVTLKLDGTEYTAGITMDAGSMITVCGVPPTGSTLAGAVIALGAMVKATTVAPVFRNEAKAT